jgi:sodium/bile acid cotransporter 7
MAAFLARRWFLLLLAGGGVVALAWPEGFAWSERLDPRFVITPALFLMALALPAHRLARAAARPGPALLAVLVSYAILPALAWLAGLALADDFRVGLLISASVPCTLASAPLWTRRAGGDEATALLVVLGTTLSSWLFAPAWIALTTGATVAVDPRAMMWDLLLTLVFPVGLGQLGRAAGPLARAVDRHRTALGVLAQLLILSILLKAAANVGVRLRAGESAPALGSVLAVAAACATVHLAALACGYWGSRGLGFDRASQIAVAFAGSQKTLPVALLLFERYFQASHPLGVLPLAFYHFGQLLLDTFVADALRPGPAPTETLPAAD